MEWPRAHEAHHRQTFDATGAPELGPTALGDAGKPLCHEGGALDAQVSARAPWTLEPLAGGA